MTFCSTRRCFVVVALLATLTANTRAQGPRRSYYFNPATLLPWAECRLESRGGSTQRIPFLPVITTGTARAPLGTDNYSRDIDVSAPVVFVGDGIVLEGASNSYVGTRGDWTSGPLDVAGKAVLLSADADDAVQETAGKALTLRRRIEEAARRGAAAVVVFFEKEEFPFPTVGYAADETPPRTAAIAISRSTAASIFEAAGIDASDLFAKWRETRQPPVSRDLIVRVRLHVEGAFRKSETAHFAFLARASELDRAVMDQIADVNERALALIFDLFKGAGPLQWRQLQTVYFADYDSKEFYTRHLGKGLASDEGVFMVHEGGVPSLGLAAHENAHILASRNWGQTSSFMNEGLGRYAEAAAVDRAMNDREAAKALREGRLFPLAELLNHRIGQPGPKTDVGYPAAGSFVGYLINRHGLTAFRRAWALEAREDGEKAAADTWTTAFGTTLADLERGWRASLERR